MSMSTLAKSLMLRVATGEVVGLCRSRDESVGELQRIPTAPMSACLECGSPLGLPALDWQYAPVEIRQEPG